MERIGLMKWCHEKLWMLSTLWTRLRKASESTAISPDEDLARFIFERRHIAKNGSAKQGAFLPELHNQQLETSVCRISRIDETRIWYLGKTIRSDKFAVARADFAVAIASNQRLNCLPAPEVNFPEHAVLIGWPPMTDKAKQKAIAAQLAAVAEVRLVPP